MSLRRRRTGWVEGDQARLKQVVVNLLDNAIKYTLQGGAVHLTVSAINSHAVLEVADNGIGIPPEALPQVFDRFFRVDHGAFARTGRRGPGPVDRQIHLHGPRRGCRSQQCRAGQPFPG